MVFEISRRLCGSMDRHAIANWIRDRRETLGLSQEALGSAVNKTGAYISAIERHSPTANPTTDVLVALVGVLGGVIFIEERPEDLTPEHADRVERLRRLSVRARPDYIDGFIRSLSPCFSVSARRTGESTTPGARRTKKFCGFAQTGFDMTAKRG